MARPYLEELIVSVGGGGVALEGLDAMPMNDANVFKIPP